MKQYNVMEKFLECEVHIPSNAGIDHQEIGQTEMLAPVLFPGSYPIGKTLEISQLTHEVNIWRSQKL